MIRCDWCRVKYFFIETVFVNMLFPSFQIEAEAVEDTGGVDGTEIEIDLVPAAGADLPGAGRAPHAAPAPPGALGHRAGHAPPAALVAPARCAAPALPAAPALHGTPALRAAPARHAAAAAPPTPRAAPPAGRATPPEIKQASQKPFPPVTRAGPCSRRRGPSRRPSRLHPRAMSPTPLSSVTLPLSL